MDCKLVIDPNAEYRQKALFEQKDTSQEDELEVRAQKSNLNYIRLDGNIGCMGLFFMRKFLKRLRPLGKFLKKL